LGGLISAFQLGGEKDEERFLIDKAVLLADRLSWGWDGSLKIPYNNVKINDGIMDKVVREPTCIAGAGTLTMEWGTLSDLTGNKTYRSLAEGAVDAIIVSKPVFPGLWPTQYFPSTITPKGDYITWGGGSDSFYEYLSKYPFLIGDADHYYLDVYRQTMDSTVKHLLKRTGVGNLTFLADYSKVHSNGTILIHSHLACFSGGNIAMTGRSMNRSDWVEIGLQLAESCAMTYQRSATGVGPVGESLTLSTSRSMLRSLMLDSIRLV
jgi:mannosyl-oligosaccharide alpha-1,2-mannosidase